LRFAEAPRAIARGTILAPLTSMDRSLVDYIAYVQSVAPLSPEQELKLARRWHERGDLAARNELIRAHLRYVLPIVRRYDRPAASLRELLAAGNLGLLHALDKFQPERGFRFVTYAKYWIRAYASECAVDNANPVFRQSRLLRKVRRAYTLATNQVGEGTAARALVADRLGLEAREVDELLTLVEHRRVSLEALTAEASSAGSCPLSNRDSPEQTLLNEDERRLLGRAVREALQNLDARERRIVEHRLMADDEAALTLKQLGEEFGVSRERVRQLEVRLRRKLAERLRGIRDAEAQLPEVAA
jgi:RNA polymerase sigma-32 factor